MQKISKIFGVILNILIAILLIIVLLVIYSNIQVKLLKKDYFNVFGYTVFQVATGSMSGTIEIKDIVIVKVINEIQQKELNVDDIIVFRQEGNIITHRIIKTDGYNIITKGDANNAEDNPITVKDVVGEVVKTVPNIGVWEKVFTTPKVYISIIITIILFIVTFSYNVNKEEADSGEKTNEK